MRRGVVRPVAELSPTTSYELVPIATATDDVPRDVIRNGCYSDHDV
jgi:hypothetical protein